MVVVDFDVDGEDGDDDDGIGIAALDEKEDVV